MKLRYWKGISTWSAKNKEYPSVSLDMGMYSMTAEITPDKIQLITHSGGGHGEPSVDDDGRKWDDWMVLFAEIMLVQQVYYGTQEEKEDAKKHFIKWYRALPDGEREDAIAELEAI